MSPIENYISEAIDIVSSWDLEDETSFANTVNAQARLLAGVPFDDTWIDDSDASIQ
jgi:hypothetical protein